MTGTTTTRDALARCLTRFETTAESATRTRFHAVIEAGDALAGPPGRLHGGLHPAARLLLPYEALVGPLPDAAPTLALELGVRRGIALAAPSALEGWVERGAEGGVALETRVDGSDKLRGTLRTVDPRGAHEALSHFAPLVEAFRRSRTVPIVGHRNLRVDVNDRLAAIPLTEGYATDETIDLVRFLGPGRTVDPVFTCVALDVIAAYAQGMNLDTRLYTTHLSLVVGGSIPVRGDGCWVLGDREAHDVDASTLAPVDVRGRPVGEQRLRVLLADARLERAFGYGAVSLVPVRSP